LVLLMKKKLAILVCAVALALALPVIAFAAPSGAVDGDTTTSKEMVGDKPQLTFTAEGADWVRIRETGGIPQNAEGFLAENMPAGNIVDGCVYEITAGDDIDKKTVQVTLIYVTDANNAGLSCYIFVQHEDGTFDQDVLPVGADGSVHYNVKGLSDVAFYVKNEQYQSNTAPAAATDTKATSPKTGIAG